MPYWEIKLMSLLHFEMKEKAVVVVVVVVVV